MSSARKFWLGAHLITVGWQLELESSSAPPGCICTVASLYLASQLEWLEQWGQLRLPGFLTHVHGNLGVVGLVTWYLAYSRWSCPRAGQQLQGVRWSRCGSHTVTSAFCWLNTSLRTSQDLRGHEYPETIFGDQLPPCTAVFGSHF